MIGRIIVLIIKFPWFVLKEIWIDIKTLKDIIVGKPYIKEKGKELYNQFANTTQRHMNKNWSSWFLFFGAIALGVAISANYYQLQCLLAVNEFMAGLYSSTEIVVSEYAMANNFSMPFS